MKFGNINTPTKISSNCAQQHPAPKRAPRADPLRDDPLPASLNKLTQSTQLMQLT